MYSSSSFDKGFQLHNQHHNQDVEQFHLPLLPNSSAANLFPFPKPWQPQIFFLSL